MSEVTIKDESISKRSLSGYGWVVTGVVWFSAVCMPLNMIKVSILAPAIMKAFGIGADTMGWVLAVFYLVGIVLAIPGAAIVDKIGYRATFISVLICGIVGGVMGYFAQTLSLFIVSRIIEGIGFGIVGVAGVPAISAWFKPSKRGVALGVWAIYVTFSFLVGPPLFSRIYASAGDYHPVWLACLVIDVVALVVFALFYREPDFVFDENEEMVRTDAASGNVKRPPMQLGRALRNPTIWIIGILFFCEELPFLGMSNFLTAYTTAETNIPITTASLIIAVMAIVGCVVNPLSGKISNRLGSNKKLMVVSCIGGTIYAWLVFQTSSVEGFVIVIIFNALAGGILPTMVWSAIPKVCENPEDIAGGTAVVCLFQQLAAFSGSRILGMAVQNFGGYAVAGQFVMAPAFALGLLVLLFAWKRLP